MELHHQAEDGETNGQVVALISFQALSHEILTLHDPAKLAAIAAERKPRMTLLPYGIPIAVGSII